MYTIITLPGATTTFASIGEWSSEVFNNFWTIAIVAIGLYVGFGIIKWIVSLFANVFGH